MALLKRLNGPVRKQMKDPKKIPVIIISFNQLNYLKKLIDFLREKGYTNIVIADNASTYEPLLEYLDSISKDVKVLRLKKNYGHLVVWEQPELFSKYTRGFYAVTDADIVPVKECPADFMLYFLQLINKHRRVNKVGFSLDTSIIPDTNTYRNNILNWESKYWKKQTEDGNFYADIDTTFALYRPKNFNWINMPFMNAVRTKPPYTAIHGGWIIDPTRLTKEQQFYMQTANESSSWKVDESGRLSSKIYHNND